MRHTTVMPSFLSSKNPDDTELDDALQNVVSMYMYMTNVLMET